MKYISPGIYHELIEEIEDFVNLYSVATIAISQLNMFLIFVELCVNILSGW